MEQYTHLLIPSDPEFMPQFAQIPAFVRLLTERWNYRIDLNDPYIPGIRLLWTTGEPEIGDEQKTGKQFTMMPRFEKRAVQRIEDIPAALEGNPGALQARRGCVAAVNGSWELRMLPITIPKSEWPEKESAHCCSLSFRLHPQTVCTSDWWGEDGDDPSKSRFGEAADLSSSMGRFTHPTSRRTVEAPNAGNARFWIEFGFGEWLNARWPEDLQLLTPELVRATEDHFGVGFAQAGRGTA
jgi:hypothetical protein